MMHPKTVGQSREKNKRRYSLVQYIGKGTYGRVYYCETYSLAVKEIALWKLWGKNGVDLLTQQIRNLIAIRHKNVVEICDYFVQGEFLYIVMEYCESNLQKYAKKNTINEKQAIRILYQILQGYKELLKARIAHRDLKPANILINKDGVIKIADFGCSKKCEQFWNLQSQIGTPLYRAPETYKNIRYTNKCDIWSLGVILYELLESKALWSAQNIQVIWNKTRGQKISFQNMRISPEVKQLIYQMLEFDPQRRISWESLIRRVGDMVKCYDREQQQRRRQKQIQEQNKTRLIQRLVSQQVEFVESALIYPKQAERKSVQKNQQNQNKYEPNVNKSESPLKNRNQNQNRNQNENQNAGSPLKYVPKAYPNIREHPQIQVDSNACTIKTNRSPLNQYQNFIDRACVLAPPALNQPQLQVKNISPQKYERRWYESPNLPRLKSPRVSIDKHPHYQPWQPSVQYQHQPQQPSYAQYQHPYTYQPQQPQYAFPPVAVTNNRRDRVVSNYCSPNKDLYEPNNLKPAGPTLRKRIDSLNKLNNGKFVEGSVLEQLSAKLQVSLGFFGARDAMLKQQEQMTDIQRNSFRQALMTFSDSQRQFIISKFNVF